MNVSDDALTATIEAPRSGLWGTWSTLGFSLLVGAVHLITQVVVVFGFALVALLNDATSDFFELTEWLTYDGTLNSLAIIAAAIVGTGVILLVIIIRGRLPISKYLGIIKTSRKTLLILLAVTVGVASLIDGMLFFLDRLFESDFMVRLYESSTWLPLLWIAVILFAPLFEETFFRGFLFVGLRRSRLGVAGTVAITALTWALIHFQYGYFGKAVIFALGIYLGVIRQKTDSLWAPVTAHALINLIAMIEIHLYVNGIIG